ncbi:amidase [Streptomonospora nanhaiensis]|uniref:Aspartyl-tRNA(Asn)/glutamyl-tRNA(Gln) amidotransferase subunit A n=1 Tax=Streptomonospora nanhaiensis TaxID=1323731 RepID=A0A853BQ64_9ACTN|nr:amidase [Streptomonospora nanhaiensis]MBV2363398.1 amidase [Streptomonospora nanhaiensis]MBX9389395.1 amidase [Streptomonospora nanhaiensis]NYI96944.1 aspartyl-tRNA(Asn)/glutamyl-tRNA(Gln) amidotransferase subunit A [Streptomonospora nanhaiensis]
MSTKFDGPAHTGAAPRPEQARPAAPDDSPAWLPATELLAAYARGDLSPVEATDAVLDRIASENPVLNAFCLVAEDEARAAARASEERWRRGEPLGRLDGVPTSIKDVMFTRGWPTLRGSATTPPDQEWAEDSPAVARLREHGAVFVGKTTTPELAWKGVTDSPLTGVTRNPWDPAKTPGGSSGGAAAAVAAGMGPLATGTDGGGSVRIPASFTGIVALKPTWGLVPHYPASAFGSLAHSGPMTRTVADAALMLDVITGPDPRDWAALAPPAHSFTASLDRPVRGLRVAYSPDLGRLAVDPEVARVVAAAVTAFEELGAVVEQVDPPIPDCLEHFHILWYSGAAKATEHITGERRELLDPGLREIIEEGRHHSAQDYLTAMATRMAMGEAMGRFHADYDLLLTPTMPIAAFDAGLEVPPGSAERRWTSWAGFSYPFNMTQQPAASVPCGFTAAGLPVGLQIVGPRHGDALVLAAARAFETARPWAHLRP